MTEFGCPNCGGDTDGSTELPYCSEDCADGDLDDGFDAEKVRRYHKRVLQARDQEVDNALYRASEEGEDDEVRVEL